LPCESDLAESYGSTESDVKSDAGSASSVDTIDVASEDDGKGSEADCVNDWSMMQLEGISQVFRWIPFYVIETADYDCQWYACQHSLSGGPPGIFVHSCSQLTEAQKCMQSQDDSGRWADMDFTPGSDQTRATLFVRNLPSSASRTWLREFLECLDLSGKFDFIYVPINFKTGMSYGYGFVNMISPDVALSAMPKIAGAFFGGATLDVCLSHRHKGLDTHIARYRNSPVMHKSVPEDFQPLMFRNGEPVGFPCPTRNVQAPGFGKHAERLFAEI